MNDNEKLYMLFKQLKLKNNVLLTIINDASSRFEQIQDEDTFQDLKNILVTSTYAGISAITSIIQTLDELIKVEERLGK